MTGEEFKAAAEKEFRDFIDFETLSKMPQDLPVNISSVCHRCELDNAGRQALADFRRVLGEAEDADNPIGKAESTIAEAVRMMRALLDDGGDKDTKAAVAVVKLAAAESDGSVRYEMFVQHIGEITQLPKPELMRFALLEGVSHVMKHLCLQYEAGGLKKLTANLHMEMWDIISMAASLGRHQAGWLRYNENDIVGEDVSEAHYPIAALSVNMLHDADDENYWRATIGMLLQHRNTYIRAIADTVSAVLDRINAEEAAQASVANLLKALSSGGAPTFPGDPGDAPSDDGFSAPGNPGSVN